MEKSMSHHILRLVLPAGAILLFACASQPPDRPSSLEQLQLSLQQNQSQLAQVNIQLDEAARLARVNALTSQLLTPALGLELLLINSPAVRADLASLGIADARALQAGLVSNPQLSLAALRPQGGGRWQLDTGINQSLLSFLTRPLQKSLAEAELREAQLQVYRGLQSLFVDFYREYFAVLAAQESLTLAQQQLLAAEAADSLAQSLLDAGNLSERQRLEHRLLMQHQQRQMQMAQAEAKTTELKLLLLLGLDGQGQVILPSRLPRLPVADSFNKENLYIKAVSRRADLQLAQAEVHRQERLLAYQQKLGGFSRLTLGLEYERETDGGYKLGPELGISLPLLDRGQYSLEQTRAALAMARARLQQAELETRTELDQQLLEMETALLLHQQLQEQSLPLQQKVQQLLLREYNYMLVSGFDLLQRKREEFVLQQQSQEALQTFWQARAQISLISGEPLIVRFENPTREDHQDHPHSHHHGAH
jgi:cobalt-zinc-cadmium efflux system outer membrane protein